MPHCSPVWISRVIGISPASSGSFAIPWPTDTDPTGNGWFHSIFKTTINDDSGLYGAGYDAWRGNAAALINGYQQAMQGLGSQKIVGHEALSEDVRVTEYENGARVYVNYGVSDYEAEGFAVPARSYQVIRGDM